MLGSVAYYIPHATLGSVAYYIPHATLGSVAYYRPTPRWEAWPTTLAGGIRTKIGLAWG